MQARLRGDFSVFGGAGGFSQADLTVAPPTQVFLPGGGGVFKVAQPVL